MNITLSENLQNLVNSIDNYQRQNWKALIKFMREKNAKYSHSDFSDTEYYDQCALSYAIQAGLIESFESDNFWEYEDVANNTFGEDAYNAIFGYEYASDFFDFVKKVLGKDIRESNTNITSTEIASVFEKMFNIPNGEYSKVTVHWKSNQKDVFASVNALKEFLELNPHRQKGYRKIVATKKVERIVYDEVEEVIKL